MSYSVDLDESISIDAAVDVSLGSSAKKISSKKPRTFFPEAWIWSNEKTGSVNQNDFFFNL